MESVVKEIKKASSSDLILLFFWKTTCSYSPAKLALLNNLIRYKKSVKVISIVLIDSRQCIDKTNTVLDEMNLTNVSHFLLPSDEAAQKFSFAADKLPYTLRATVQANGDFHIKFEDMEMELVLNAS